MLTTSPSIYKARRCDYRHGRDRTGTTPPRKIHGGAVVGVDIDPRTVRNQRATGRDIPVGDPSDTDFWDRVQATHSIELVMLPTEHEHGSCRFAQLKAASPAKSPRRSNSKTKPKSCGSRRHDRLQHLHRSRHRFRRSYFGVVNSQAIPKAPVISAKAESQHASETFIACTKSFSIAITPELTI